MAKALNVELIAPPFDGLTTVDGGGHLDKKGAKNSRNIWLGNSSRRQLSREPSSGKLTIANQEVRRLNGLSGRGRNVASALQIFLKIVFQGGLVDLRK